MKSLKSFGLVVGAATATISLTAVAFSWFAGSGSPRAEATGAPSLALADDGGTGRPEPRALALIDPSSGDLGPEPEEPEIPTIADRIDEGTVFVARAHREEGEVAVWSEPELGTEPAWSLPVPTEFYGPRYFAVIGESGDFYQITVPVRPNGSVGWIPKADVEIAEVSSRIVVDLSERELTAYVDSEPVMTLGVAIGRPDHPTPIGDWYIRDELPWYEDSVYGPYVLALSAYSDTIDQINGGDAVVALHGTVRPDLIGDAVSLGCIRIENSEIIQLAEIIEPGTPVSIVE